MTQEERLTAFATLLGVDLKSIRDRPAVVFNSDHFEQTFVKVNPDYDPETPGSPEFLPTVDTDPDRISFISNKGPAPEVLPPPAYGVVTKSSTAYSAPVTNKPAGAEIIWTDNGDEQPGNDTPLMRTGQAPESVHEIIARFTKNGVEGPTSQISITLDAAGAGPAKTIYVNFAHPAVDDPTDTVTWNNIKKLGYEIGDADAFTQALVDSTNSATGFSIRNTTGFGGTEQTIKDPATSGTIFPTVVSDSGFRIGAFDEVVSVEFSGLNNSKTYNIKALFNTNQSGITDTRLTVSGQTDSVDPRDNVDELAVTENVAPASGVIVASFDKVVSNFNAPVLCALIIEEN